jgi:hypothetical protein
MFACAHPAIDPSIRAPLILQTILGFDAAVIGSAFLVSPATMGQRLVRGARHLPDRQPAPRRTCCRSGGDEAEDGARRPVRRMRGAAASTWDTTGCRTGSRAERRIAAGAL